MELIMQVIYKSNDHKVRYLDSKCFGIFFLIKGIKTYNRMLYVHTQTKKRSGSTTHRHQPADDWHQSHRQLQQMQHVSFSFNNDNNEKEKNNIYYICFLFFL